jgi:hypothetical protein
MYSCGVLVAVVLVGTYRVCDADRFKQLQLLFI